LYYLITATDRPGALDQRMALRPSMSPIGRGWAMR